MVWYKPKETNFSPAKAAQYGCREVSRKAAAPWICKEKAALAIPRPS